MNKVVIVNKIYLRKNSFYESKFLSIYFTFGDRIVSNKLICMEGDFDYVEVFRDGHRGFLPLEYLLDESIFIKMGRTSLFKDNLYLLPYNMTSGNAVYVREDLYPYLCEMFEHSRKENISLSIISGYIGVRELSSEFPYEYEKLFMQRILEKPCISPYHSASVLNITSSEINNRISMAFHTTKAYKWLCENGSKYNFHISLIPFSDEDINTWKPFRIYFAKEVFNSKAINNIPSTLHSFSKSLIVDKKTKLGNKNLKYIFLHNSEHTARLVARYGLALYGGTLYELINGDERNIGIDIGFTSLYYDPNRIFTDSGLRANLFELNEGIDISYIDMALKEIVFIRNNFLKLLDINLADIFIALHTNNRFSSLSVNSFSDAKDSFSIHTNKLHNPKNFFYTIDIEAFLFFGEKGYNVVLQQEDILCDDGSFSILMSRLEMSFVTIEVQEGYFVFQKEMLSLAISYFAHNEGSILLP